MHPIFHSFKRLYWSSMRFARDWAGDHGITPARLDVLIIIAQAGHGGVSQSDIHLILDVCAPVITRMLNSMEKRGLIERHDDPSDGRRNTVTMTPRAQSLLRTAVAQLLHDGYTERALRVLVAPGATRHRAVERAMRHAREYGVRQRTYLLDASVMRYPGYLPNGERSPDHPVRRGDDVYPPRRAA